MTATTMTASPTTPPGEIDSPDARDRAFLAKWRAGDKYRIPETPAVRAACKVIGDAIRKNLPAAYRDAVVSLSVWEVTDNGEPDGTIGNELFI